MVDSFRDKIRSVNVGLSRRRLPKTTTINEQGSTRTEHWNDRVDVNIHPAAVLVKDMKGRGSDG